VRRARRCGRASRSVATESTPCSASSSTPKTAWPSRHHTWRGVTRRKPILTGRSYLRIGSILTGKIVVYPIVDDIDRDGNQLINWMAEIKRDTFDQNDWNKPGNVNEFLPIYRDYRFDWLDIAELIRNADQILEYPMVDKDPVDRWNLRPRHAGGRCRPSDVSARLERRRPGRD